MTRFHDLFVGLVAMVLGCMLLGGAVAKSQMLIALTKTRRLADLVGAGPARWIIAAIGAACIAMGLLIASGWRIRW
jgi:hypothetical protein